MKQSNLMLSVDRKSSFVKGLQGKKSPPKSRFKSAKRGYAAGLRPNNPQLRGVKIRSPGASKEKQAFWARSSKDTDKTGEIVESKSYLVSYHPFSILGWDLDDIKLRVRERLEQHSSRDNDHFRQVMSLFGQGDTRGLTGEVHYVCVCSWL